VEACKSAVGGYDPLQSVAHERSGHSHRGLDPARAGMNARAAVANGAPHFVDVVVQRG
jgi:hypothetical protein